MKWTGTILCLLGIGLTSWNVYPINLWFGFIGSACWTYAGIVARDWPLILVEGIAVAVYLLGIGRSIG